MKVLKTLLLVTIVWAALAAVILLIVHYSRDLLVVEIHWKKDGTLSQRSRSNTPAIYDNDFEVSKPNVNRTVASRPNKQKVKEPIHTKIKELPVHTLKSMYKNCSDTLCLKHLSDKERVYFDECKQKTISLAGKFGPITNSGQCRFQNGTNRVPVALASFPGSGNTWVRGLLEKVTGFCTGNH